MNPKTFYLYLHIVYVMVVIERIKTGIRGFDNLVEGGLPKGSCILMSGTPGTGKTIFGVEFISRGAEKFGEKGLYISFEESSESITEQAEQLNLDVKKHVSKGIVKFLCIPAEEISNNTVNDIIKMIKDERINRVVIDSLSTLAINSPYTVQNPQTAMNRFIYSFVNSIKRSSNVTSMLISHTADDKSLSKDSISEFICDGIIHVIYESMGGDLSRSLLVRKMRKTKNDEDIHPLEITSKGLVVHSIK
ncbi:AAA family ATPase [Candidatus Woesearchaeota archaeon]|nr:AAA family ATPase [Candidatus Woesearchaeota archaeon]